MRGPSRLFVIGALAIYLTLLSIAAADSTIAKREFDKLSDETKAQIVIGLIVTGDFNGVYDREFSPRLEAAIESFQSREKFAPTGVLESNQIELLRSKGQAFTAPLDLSEFLLPHSQLKVYVPRLLFDEPEHTDWGFAFERADKTISLSFKEWSSKEATFEDLYTKLATNGVGRIVKYKALRPTYFVSSGEFRGRNFYTWVYRTPYGPAGLTLAWTSVRNALADRLAILMVNTFTTGEAPKPAEPSPVPKSPPPAGSPPQTAVTGTGFLISSAGHLITNYHVVSDCKSIFVRKPGLPALSADLVSKNIDNDLALLKTGSIPGSSIAKLRGGAPIRAGDEIVIYGFPLVGSLSSEGNVVAGNITALSGLGDDRRFLQVSAPVQLGNSGGPLLDRSGHVVGVVQSKLDALLVSREFGDIPQNVNFAIQEPVLKDFLDWVGTQYSPEPSLQNFSVSELRDKAQAFTVLVECRR